MKNFCKILLGLVLASILVLLLWILVSSRQFAIKPHIYYNDTIYYQEHPTKEYDFGALQNSLVEDGSINTLRKDTEVCDNNYEANRPHYLGAFIYKQQNGDFDFIYVQLPSSKDVVFLFQATAKP